MQVRGMAWKDEKTSEKLKVQAVQKGNHRQKTARILYCRMQVETYPGEIRWGTWGKKVRKMRCYTGQRASHVLYCQMSSLVQPCSTGKTWCREGRSCQKGKCGSESSWKSCQKSTAGSRGEKACPAWLIMTPSSFTMTWISDTWRIFFSI